MRLNDDGRGTHFFTFNENYFRAQWVDQKIFVPWPSGTNLLGQGTRPNNNQHFYHYLLKERRLDALIEFDDEVSFRASQCTNPFAFVARLWQSSGHKTLLARI